VKKTREDFMVNGVVVPEVTEHGIYGLFGPYRCLSNFHQHSFLYQGLSFHTSEAAYMAQKTLNRTERMRFSMMMTGVEAKKFGQQIELREDWDEVHRLHSMYRVLFAKFTQDLDSMDVLLSTGKKYIEETNWWGDRYWGVCDGTGHNHLGNILMTVRDFIAYL
jgi:ribA/ribD-fused uncharacterized protein